MIRADRAWPASEEELIATQRLLAVEAEAALRRDPFRPGGDATIGGCFVAFARGGSGPGRPGDRAWAAAVGWRPGSSPFRQGDVAHRRADDALRGAAAGAGPRRASDVAGQAVVEGRVPAGYAAGLLALREGPILAAAVGALEPVPGVLLVDATGLDHPRGAGLALHLGAVAGIPTVGVTHRPLHAAGDLPQLVRGESSPVRLEHRAVGAWVCTSTGARPVLAHAGWRTGPDTAVAVVLMASTGAARTPVPLQEARRAAREARALSGGAR